MTLQVLISTMHQDSHDLLDRMNIQSDAVVINQCDDTSSKSFLHNGHSILWFNTTERGLSKSRNMAIKNATADICVVADDDLIYRKDYENTIIAAFQSHSFASIIGFEVHGIETDFKDYPAEEHSIGYVQSMKMASVEISFRRKAIVSNHIYFDELIGAGTKFLLGEENAFLFQCLKQGLKIHFVPIVVLDLHVGNSTWFSGHNEHYFIAKGAAFAAMQTSFTNLIILQWAVRKRPMFKDESSLISALKLMIKGQKEYQKDKRDNDMKETNNDT